MRLDADARTAVGITLAAGVVCPVTLWVDRAAGMNGASFVLALCVAACLAVPACLLVILWADRARGTEAPAVSWSCATCAVEEGREHEEWCHRSGVMFHEGGER